MKSWISVSHDNHFPLQNLPLGIMQTPQHTHQMVTIIGDCVINLAVLEKEGLFRHMNLPAAVFQSPYLNDFLSYGKETILELKRTLRHLFDVHNPSIRDNQELQHQCMLNVQEANLVLPVYIRDYTDFYSSEEHATNVGIMFRGKENALMPNWKHMPIAYHGRASSIVVSGTPIHRPKGQTRPDDAQPPVYGPSKQLDFELEMGFVIGKSTELGQTISTQEAESYMAGMLIFNDWSARDLQKWEYQPLGPFLGKNFGSSSSPWLVTMDALEPFKVASPPQDVPILPYLAFEGDKSYDIHLEIQLQPKDAAPVTICKSNHKYLYWTMVQQLAHHTVNGCNLNIGDLMASGTISGKTEDSFGSMLELAWKGTKPLQMSDGTTRVFLQDYDTIIMTAYCEKEGVRVGFGEVRTQILPVK